ncbi:tyrosine-type recombinase/integrase [Kibdelosporangium aridum]
MRQLYDALPQLGSPNSHHLRIAVEVIMDTGRRPDEIFQIGFNCLDTDDDGKHVLIYTDFKNNREERRLPITDTTAALLRDQQRRVRDRFPDTPLVKLKLFPAPYRNPDGTCSLSEKLAATRTSNGSARFLRCCWSTAPSSTRRS